MKILFMGSSIKRHPPKTEIGRYGDYGMAAPCHENDYVHLLCRMLEKKESTLSARLKIFPSLKSIPDIEVKS